MRISARLWSEVSSALSLRLIKYTDSHIRRARLAHKSHPQCPMLYPTEHLLSNSLIGPFIACGQTWLTQSPHTVMCHASHHGESLSKCVEPLKSVRTQHHLCICICCVRARQPSSTSCRERPIQLADRRSDEGHWRCTAMSVTLAPSHAFVRACIG